MGGERASGARLNRSARAVGGWARCRGRSAASRALSARRSRSVAVGRRGCELLGRRIDASRSAWPRAAGAWSAACRPAPPARRARGQAARRRAPGQPHVDVARRPRPRGRRARGSAAIHLARSARGVAEDQLGPVAHLDDDAVLGARLDRSEARPQRRGRGAGDARRVERGRVGQAVAVRRRRAPRSSGGCPRPGCPRRIVPSPATGSAAGRSAAGRYSITSDRQPVREVRAHVERLDHRVGRDRLLEHARGARAAWSSCEPREASAARTRGASFVVRPVTCTCSTRRRARSRGARSGSRRPRTRRPPARSGASA